MVGNDQSSNFSSSLLIYKTITLLYNSQRRVKNLQFMGGNTRERSK